MKQKKKSEHPAMYQNAEAFRNALSSLSIQNIYSNYPHAVSNAIPQDFAPASVPSSSINLDSFRGSSDQSNVIESLKPNAQVPVYPGGMYSNMTSNQQLGTPEMGVPNALLLLNNPYQFHPMAQAAYLNNQGWNDAMNQRAPQKISSPSTKQQDSAAIPNGKGSSGTSADSSAHCPPKKGRGRPKRNPKEGWPKRPLSAYNIFFKNEREKLLKSMKEPTASNDSNTKTRTRKNRQAKHGKISFSDLAKTIGSKWKKLTQEEKNQYEILAAYNLQKYKEELREFTEKRDKEKSQSSK